jgi:hypothetical protein
MISRIRRALGHDLWSTLMDDAEAVGLRASGGDPAIVTAADVDALPAPVARYMRFMGVIGRPRDWSFQAKVTGRFRMRPGQRFMPFEAWQYNTRFPVARLFHMRIDFAGFVPMIGRDSYVGGHGRMRGKLLGLVPVADSSGRELDVSELVTWLNDSILLSPSMLLDDATSWSAAGDDAFDVSFTDGGTTVTARVLIDERGAPSNFSTRDRYAALPGGLLRAEWTTPITQWKFRGGQPLPGPGSAIWHLPEGPFTYVEGGVVPATVVYNGRPEPGTVERVAS